MQTTTATWVNLKVHFVEIKRKLEHPHIWYLVIFLLDVPKREVLYVCMM